MTQQFIDLDTIPEADIVRKNTIETILEDLEVSGIAAIAQERSKAEKLLAELQQKADDSRADWKEKIARQEVVVERYKKNIDTEKLERAVQCVEVFKSGNILIVRDDESPQRGTVVRVRPPDQKELQRHLPNTNGTGVLAQAAQAQKDANVEENEDGDIDVPEGDGKTKRKAKK